MKLNNKGFAITAVLYGLLILFVILVSSYLLVLSVKKDRVEDLVNEIENSYYGTMTRLSYHISNLYNEASKVIVTNNGAEYNYALSVNLMNDRAGGKTSDYNGGNIRYYGSDPNNYIYFNCSDYDNQSSDTCELWRIIGVFDYEVKLIKNDSIGNYEWDNESNNWNTSTLKDMLNSGTYYDTLTEQTKDLLYQNTWYLGYDKTTKDPYKYTPSDMYNAERSSVVHTGNPKMWQGYIGLMYPSDYMYSADFNSCNKTLQGYNDYDSDKLCTSNNWIFNYTESSEWTITPESDDDMTSWAISMYGGYDYDNDPAVDAQYNIRPTLYLQSYTYINNEGDGSSTNPYQIYYR